MEERAVLNQDTPLDDFAAHFYYTRYTKMKGVPMETFEDLCVDFKANLEASVKKHTPASLLEIQATGQSPLVWSMNWYSLPGRNPKSLFPGLAGYERGKLESIVYDIEAKNEGLALEVFILPPSGSGGVVLVAVAVRLGG